MAHEERDQTIREHNKAHQGVSSLQADLRAMVARRLEAESVSAGLGIELAEVQGILQAESDEHDLLRATVGVVFDDLGVAWPEETSSLVARAVDITARVHQLEQNAFHSWITQAHSHYDHEINLEVMSLGFAPGYENSELDEMRRR